jgi:hypothetical protein
MTLVLIVEKSGNIKECSIKSKSELVKKAGYKTEEEFKFVHTWNVCLEDIKYNISLHGKTTGKANTENKYDFPPPIDTELFFGNCILVNRDEDDRWTDLTVNEWEKIYEYLFKGFEDLEDLNDEISDDDFGDLQITKNGGYLKDGFVVDDNDEEEEDEEEDEDEDEDEIIIRKAKTLPRKVAKKVEQEIENETYLDCQSELSEEAYFSDK